MNLTIVDGLFANNRAERHAGGIAAWRITGERTRIVNNVAVSGNGGGIYFSPSILHGTVALSSTQVISNTAGERGGGLYLGVEQARLVGMLIADNRAAITDGLVLDPATLDAAQLSLTNVTLTSAVPSPHAAIQIGVMSPDSPVAVSLVNTVVTSHTLGIMRPGNSTLTGDYNAFFGNEVDQEVLGVDTPLPFANLLTADRVSPRRSTRTSTCNQVARWSTPATLGATTAVSSISTARRCRSAGARRLEPMR